MEIEWEDERNGEVIAEVLRVLDSRNVWPQQDTEYVTWAAPLARESNGSSVTCEEPTIKVFLVIHTITLKHYSLDIIYRETAWECISRLSETLFETFYQDLIYQTPLKSPYPIPRFDSDTLFLLPIVEGVARGGRPGPTGNMDNICGSPLGGGTSSIVYRSFTDVNNFLSPSFGVQALNFYQNGTGGSVTQKDYYNRYIAALVARLPLAAIAYANERLPCQSIGQYSHGGKYVISTLEVKWNRVAIVVGTIVASQILGITIVLYYCRNVYVREDSNLTTAELLKTVLSKIEDGDKMTAKELGDSLDRVLEGPVSYGTIPGVQGDQPRVALGCEVDYNFPGFPPFQKHSVFRR